MSKPQTKRPPRRGSPTVETLVVPSMVVASLGAAAIHLATAGEHDALFGFAFLAMAAFQGAWAGAIILIRAPIVLLGGIAGQGAIVGTWLAAHTNGLPFGPGAGNPEPIGFKDVTATVLELIAIGGAFLLLRPDAARGFRAASVRPVQPPLALAALVILATVAVLTPHAHGPGAHGHQEAAAHGHGEDDGHAPGEEDHGHPPGDDHDATHHGEGTAEHGHDVSQGDTGSAGHGHGADEDHGDEGHDGNHDGHDDPGHDHGTGGGDPGPGDGEESAVVAGPFAESAGYADPTVEVESGGRLIFRNFDLVGHDVVHDVAADGFGGSTDMPWCGEGHHTDGPCPVFWSPVIEAGETTVVLGMRNVEAGRSYSFFCTLHHSMQGTLVVR
jgi:hypothetical protein